MLAYLLAYGIYRIYRRPAPLGLESLRGAYISSKSEGADVCSAVRFEVDQDETDADMRSMPHICARSLHE
jgi:hypothetical protein